MRQLIFFEQHAVAEHAKPIRRLLRRIIRLFRWIVRQFWRIELQHAQWRRQFRFERVVWRILGRRRVQLVDAKSFRWSKRRRVGRNELAIDAGLIREQWRCQRGRFRLSRWLRPVGRRQCERRR
jgi:hypothetical protein